MKANAVAKLGLVNIAETWGNLRKEGREGGCLAHGKHKVSRVFQEHNFEQRSRLPLRQIQLHDCVADHKTSKHHKSQDPNRPSKTYRHKQLSHHDGIDYSSYRHLLASLERM